MKSSTELEQELAEAKRAEREAEKVARAEQRQHDREVKALRDQARGIVADVKRTVADALTFAESNPATTLRAHRAAARAWLRGQLVPPGELEPSQHRLAHIDAGLQALLGAAETAARHISLLSNPVREPAFLGEGDEPIRQLDALEVRAWGAFVDRVRTIAGET